MSLFSIFGKIREEEINWPVVAGNIARLLWAQMNMDPKSLANPYARIILKKNSTVFLSGDKRDPKYFLGWGDVSYVLIHEDAAALKKWVEKLKEYAEAPPFQQIATEEFAKTLTRTLMETGSAS